MSILAILKFLKNYWWILLIVITLIAIGFARHYKNKAEREAERADRWKGNHDEVVTGFEQAKDELGRTETEVKQYRLTVKELQSDLYQKNGTLETLRKELEYSNVKIKNLQDALVAELESSNQGETVIRDTVFKTKSKEVYDYFDMNDGYLDFKAWWLDPDSVDWFYQYNETIYYWTELKRDMYNNSGNKRFFLWRVWPFKLLLPEIPETKVKSINPNSQIKAEKYDIVD